MCLGGIIIKKILSLMFICIIMFSFTSCVSTKNTNKNIEKHTKEIYAMDTIVTITVYNKEQPEEAFNKVEKEIKKLEEKFSTTFKNSDVNKINTNPTSETKVSKEIIEVIKIANEVSKKTKGAFDISVYPLVKAWGFTKDEHKVPKDAEIKKLLNYVDYTKITINEQENTVKLKENMALDMGGIAKGYIAEVAANILLLEGIESGIVNAGGDIKTFGNHPEKENWTIAIEYAEENTSSYLGVVKIKDKSVITSGAYQRYFEENGKKYHHIINPKTGKPSDSKIKSSTVIADSITKGDGLSTAFFVMGVDKSIEYYKEYKDVDFILLTVEDEIYITEGISNSFTIDEKYKDNKIIVVNK